MNIQVFGTKKCFDTKKAERYFKERNIKYQLIDLKEKGMSKGELNNVLSAVGGLDVVINPDAKDQDAIALIKYISPEDKIDKLLENQQVLKTPIVRNGKQATVGYQPDVWKNWE
ncbi:MAG: arsenate reductase family protein [Lachnospiraceae bacterium]|nr:arsenate reductase family protein [Candidatus Colinaster equi]